MTGLLGWLASFFYLLSTVVAFRSHSMVRLALTCVVFALAAQQGHANSLLDALGFPADSGKIAKFEFRLRDSIPVTAVAWSPNGRYIATASTQSNLVHIWDVQQRSIAKELRLESSGMAFRNLSFSPDGRYLAACGKPVLHVYSTDTWEDVGKFSPSIAGGCIRAAFSSDGREMALLSEPRYLRVFSVPTWELGKTSSRDTWGRWGNRAEDLAYLPGTRTLVLAGSEYLQPDSPPVGQLWLLRPDETVPGVKFQAYCCVADGHGGAGGADGLAVSPDGLRIVTGTNTGSGVGASTITQAVHIFDASTYKLLGAPLDGVEPVWPLRALAYTPDGRFIIVGQSSQWGGVVHLIDAKTLRVVDMIHVDPYIYDAAAKPDGTAFAVGADGQVLVWALSK